MKGIKRRFLENLCQVGVLFLDIGVLRGLLVRHMEQLLWKAIVEEEGGAIRPAQELKFCFVRNLLRCTDRHLRKGWMSRRVFHRMARVFARGVLLEDTEERDKVRGKEAVPRPSFIVISPTQRCNLRCPGCYASSNSHTRGSLPYGVVSRILREKTLLWHSHFTVVSGGEPFLWRSEGKGIVELARQHDDNFFMVYTNGTLIDEEVADSLAAVGNFTPVISVEGFEEKTDRRRGKGTFRKVLQAFDRLRRAGVPFGISVVADRENWDEVTSREFLRFFFDEEGAFYGWLFQYMPIGRGYSLREMVTAEERLEMFRRDVEAIKAGYNYIDFWNQGVMTDGCLAAGRMGGYLYIDWNGNVMPCVFVPYYEDNILEIYRRGGSLDDVLNSPFFRKIRGWQEEYALGKPPEERGNLILPCPIRDHHEVIWRLLREMKIKAADPSALEILEDEAYHRGMLSYDEELKEVLDPVWDAEFRRPCLTAGGRV